MKHANMRRAVVIVAMSAAIAGFSAEARADAKDMKGKEKCYGVAKAGKNDCGGGTQSCAGQATRDGQANAFVAVPKGLCEKLAGGSTAPTK